MSQQKRQSFRLAFPRSYHPLLFLAENTFTVCDASEFGVRFKHNDVILEVNTEISVHIKFPDGKHFPLKSKVIRNDKNFTCLELLTPIPLSKIRSEHLFIIKHYVNKDKQSTQSLET